MKHLEDTNMKEYRKKEKLKRLLDSLILEAKLPDKMVVEMLEELIKLYK
jgi:hypothetical protein